MEKIATLYGETVQIAANSNTAQEISVKSPTINYYNGLKGPARIEDRGADAPQIGDTLNTKDLAQQALHVANNLDAAHSTGAAKTVVTFSEQAALQKKQVTELV